MCGDEVVAGHKLGPEFETESKSDRIDGIELASSAQAYYDLEVTPHHNYWMSGAWHHNSGTTSAAMDKVAMFVMNQKPPRPDTPFWILANTYEQTMRTCWSEKLEGQRHLPAEVIDYPRILWYSEKRGWPYSVPLKPWPGTRNNWSIEFKSYEQGRARMQAESIGGFCFVEQFGWDILVEVLRGCRVYNFPGSKFAEFTPVDPNLSIELEEMIESDSLPASWELYRCNTECAAEAGHVNKVWFDEFFAMVPEEMRATRMTGEFAVYEGAIYQFNKKIHTAGDDVFTFPNGVHYRRAIDWGSGPENPFVCLWAYRDGVGRWFIFDEYYSTEPITTVRHLENVHERSVFWGWDDSQPEYGTTWADPSGVDNIRIASELHKYSDCPPIAISAANNSVLRGIEHVQYLLMNDPSDDRPRILFHSANCKNCIREFRTYRWKKSTGAGVNPADARREPLKKNDHSCDSTRYLTFSEANIAGVAPTSTSRRASAGERHGVKLVKR